MHFSALVSLLSAIALVSATPVPAGGLDGVRRLFGLAERFDGAGNIVKVANEKLWTLGGYTGVAATVAAGTVGAGLLIANSGTKQYSAYPNNYNNGAYSSGDYPTSSPLVTGQPMAGQL